MCVFFKFTDKPKSAQMKIWLKAFRLRTLPLAVASIFLGSCLAYQKGLFDAKIAFLTFLTAVLLQILSNLANDYGDSINGADHAEREGPVRAVQGGEISRKTMLNAVSSFVLMSLTSGLLLLWVSFSKEPRYFFIFLLLGIAAILAAIFYTMGKKPYGYAGLGDVSVLIFFGWVGTLGSFFLHAKTFFPEMFLPATGIGLMAVAVLNVNNIRDIESDKKAGKLSVPVRLGRKNALLYHAVLLIFGQLSGILYLFLVEKDTLAWLFLLNIPVSFVVFMGIKNAKSARETDKFLKKTALNALLYAVLMGIILIF